MNEGLNKITDTLAIINCCKSVVFKFNPTVLFIDGEIKFTVRWQLSVNR